MAPASAAPSASPAVPGSADGYMSYVFGSVFGETISKAEQLPALQASFRSAMEELSRQTAQNSSLRAELKGLRDAATLRARAAHLAPALVSPKGLGSPRGSIGSRAPPAVDGASTPAGGEESGGNGECETPEVMSTEEQKEWLNSASKGFESATASLQEAAAQRKEVMRGISDVLWQLKRNNPDERLEARPTMAELEKMKDAVER